MINPEEFIDSLIKIFENTIDEKKIHIEKHDIIILDLDLDDLWAFLKYKWSYIDSIAINFSESCREYEQRKDHWNKILQDSIALSDIDFILKHSEYKIFLSNLQKEGKLNEEQIDLEKKNILKKVPKLITQEIEEKLINWNNQKIYSFKIYDSVPLKVNLHIRLDKIRFYNFLIFFTFAIKNPGKNDEFSMEMINNYYHSFIISYELINLIKAFNFKEVDNLYANNEIYNPLIKNSQVLSYPTITEEVVQIHPFLFQCFYLNLLQNSAQELFIHLSNILKDVNRIIKNYEELIDPKTYYSNFQDDLKEFLKKGKEIFYKSEELIYELSEQEDELIKRKHKKAKITADKLSNFSQKEYYKDIKNQINVNDAGYRSVPEIYNIYKEDIKISWANFNRQASEIMKDSSKFEIRERQKKGGGIEFRIIPKQIEYFNYEKPTIASESFLSNHFNEANYENLLKYEQADIYYSDGQYDKTINLYEDIFNSYPEKSNEFSLLYSDVAFRLGNLYIDYGNFSLAEFYYNKGKENFLLTEPTAFPFIIEELKIKRLKGSFHQLTTEITELEKEIKDLIKKNLKKLNANFKYIDGLEIQDLDIYFIRNLKRDPGFNNNPVFQETLQLDKNLLKLNLLKLDLLRKEIFIQITKSPLKFIEEDGKKKKLIIPESIVQILKEVDEILYQVFNNKFNWGDINYILFGLYKTYFENVKIIDKRPYFEDFNYGIPITFFPTYYTKFLFNVINYDWQYQIFNQLDKEEFRSLDNESKAEYLVKFCEFKCKQPGYMIYGGKFLAFFKNLKTLIEYAITIIKENKIDYLYKLADSIRVAIENELKNFAISNEKIKELLKKK